jgi:uncharacterized peroxidase-related enzyme
MPHIALGNDLPGIVGLLRYRPETGSVLNQLAEMLLRGDNTLTRGERELIAARVSTLNECEFCASTHAACSAEQSPGGADFVETARRNPGDAVLSPKLGALLDIAGAVQRGGLNVTTAHAEAAREAGATDAEIHDTVLIAAAFCMYNRYVDGLGTLVPQDPADYAMSAKRIVAHGYTAAAAQQP